MLLEGIFLPVPTSFYPDGRLYPRKIEHNVDRYSRTPAAGLLILGDAAEAAGLTDADARSALAAAVAAAAPEKVLLAGISRESVFAALELAAFAAELRYDAVVTSAPAFTDAEGMLPAAATYLRCVADRSPLPVVIAVKATHPLPVELLAGLAAHPNVIGCVANGFSAEQLYFLRGAAPEREVTVTPVFAPVTARMLRVGQPAQAATFVAAETLSAGGTAVAVAPPQPALRTRTRRVGFQVLAGQSEGLLEQWKAGAGGAILALGACAPQTVCEVWQAQKDGDESLAAAKLAKVHAAEAAFGGASEAAAIKHGCDVNGYFGGRPRLPLVALTADQRALVERALGGMKN